MNQDDVAWLIEEIDESLDAGPVGLYEFIWTLRGRYPDAALEAMKQVARPALDATLEDDAVKLGWYEWPPRDPIRPASAADLDDHAFDDIGDGPYLGIERR